MPYSLFHKPIVLFWLCSLCYSLTTLAQCPPIGFDINGGTLVNGVLYFECNAPIANLSAWDFATAGGYITPGYTINVQTDGFSDLENTLFVYNGSNATGTPQFHWSASASILGGTWMGPLPINSNFDAIQEYLDPTLFYSVEWCDYPAGFFPPDGDFPYTITDNATGLVLGSGIFSHNGVQECFTVNVDPPLGIAQFSGAGVTNLGNGNGTGSFNPALAGVGTHTITYSWNSQNGCSGTATQTVVVGTPPPTIPPQNLTYCQGEAAIALTATGQNILWYDDPNGVGNVIPYIPNTDAAGTFTYYVSQTLPNCIESDLVPIEVTVLAAPIASFSLSPNPICTGQTLVADYNGTEPPANLTFEWTTPIGNNSSSSIIINDISLAEEGDYSLIITQNGCSSEAVTQSLIVTTPPESPTVLGEANICNDPFNGSTINLNDLILSGSTDGVWTDSDNSGAVGSVDNLNFDGIPAGNYVFIYALDICGTVEEYLVTVTVAECGCPSVETIAPVGTLCNVDGTFDLTNLQITTQAGTWSIGQIPIGPIPATINGTIFDATNANPGQYEVIFTLNNPVPPGCPNISSQFIDVIPPPFTGIGNTVLVCNNQNQDLVLADYVEGEQPFGTWQLFVGNPTPGAVNFVNNTFNPFGQTAGVYSFSYSIQGSGANCPSDITTLTFQVGAPAVVGTDTSITACNNQSTPISLSQTLQGEQSGGLWTLASGTPPGGFSPAFATFNPDGQATGIHAFNYTINTNNGCPAASAQVAINVVQPIGANVTPNVSVCNSNANGSSIINFVDLITAGSTAGEWTDTDNSGASGAFSNLDFTGVPTGAYTFTYSLSQDPCEPISYTVAVTVQNCACPDVTTITPSEVCNSLNAFDLNTLLFPTTQAGTWAITATPNGSNPATISGADFIPTNADTGDYQLTYTLTNPSASPTCPDSSVQTLTVVAQPQAGTDATDNICNTATTPLNLLSYLPDADAGGTWSSTGLAPDAGAFNANTGTFTTEGHSPGTYTFAYTQAGIGGCSADGASVTITIDAPIVAGTDTADEYCNGTGNIINLFSLVPDAVVGGAWSTPNIAPDAGTFSPLFGTWSIGNHTPGSYDFAYTIASSNACPTDTAWVNITIDGRNYAGEDNNALFCSQQDTLLNLNSFIENQPVGGVWIVTNGIPTPASAFNAINGTFQVTGQFPDIYGFTYIVDDSGICPADSATVVITITNATNAGTGGIFTICNNDTNLVNLADIVNGEDPNGIWELNDTSAIPPANAFDTANGTFNPDAISPDTYTFNYITQNGTQCGSDTALAIVNIILPPNAGIDTDTTICNDTPDVVNLNNLLQSEQSGGMWSIASDNPIFPATAFNAANATFNTAGLMAQTYTLQYIVAGGNACQSDTAFVSITVELCNCPNVPTPTLVSNDTISGCAGTINETAFVVSTAAGTNVAWYDAPSNGNLLSTGIEFYPDTVGTYYAFAVDVATSCMSDSLVFFYNVVSMENAANFSLSDTLVCVNTDVTATINGTPIAGSAYTWDFEGSGTQNTATPTPVSWVTDGTNIVSLIVSMGTCADTAQQVVNVASVSAAFSNDNITIEQGDDVTLNLLAESSIGSPLTIEWTPATDLSCDDCTSPVASPPGNTTYTVLMSDELGCSAEADVTITVIRPNKLRVPTAFSPNGDDVNDIFRAVGYNVRSLSMKVYDRWGTLMYSAETDDLLVGWDGLHNGLNAPLGVYVYYIDVVYTDDKTEHVQGNVTLVR